MILGYHCNSYYWYCIYLFLNFINLIIFNISIKKKYSGKKDFLVYLRIYINKYILILQEEFNNVLFIMVSLQKIQVR